MKLTLILLLVVGSVALLRAEEDAFEDEPHEYRAMMEAQDGTLEDEIQRQNPDLNDPLTRKGLHAFKDKFRCKKLQRLCFKKLGKKGVPKMVRMRVCRAHYFWCRCIIKGVRHCKKFLGFVKKLKKIGKKIKQMKGKKNDEDEDEDEDEDKKKPAGLCKGVRKRYRAICKKDKNSKKCKKLMTVVKKVCKKNKKSDENDDEDEYEIPGASEETADEFQEDEEDFQVEEPKLSKKKLRKVKKVFFRILKRCGMKSVRCTLRAGMNCRRQGRCHRRFKRCMRRAVCSVILRKVKRKIKAAIKKAKAKKNNAPF